MMITSMVTIWYDGQHEIFRLLSSWDSKENQLLKRQFK